MTEADYLAYEGGEMGEFVPGAMICPCCMREYTDPEEVLAICPSCDCHLLTPEEIREMEDEERADAKRKEMK